MQGIFHAYYTVALAPAIGALVGMGAAALWRRRDNLFALLTLAATVAVTAIWSYVLLGRTAGLHPWLRAAVLLAGSAWRGARLAARPQLARRPARRVGLAVAAAGTVAALGRAGRVRDGHRRHRRTAARSRRPARPWPAPAGPRRRARRLAGPAGAARRLPQRRGGARRHGGLAATRWRRSRAARSAVARSAAARRVAAAGAAWAACSTPARPSAELVALLRQTPAHYTWVARRRRLQQRRRLPAGHRTAGHGRSAASTAATRARPWRSSSSTSPRGEIHYFLGGAASAAATAAAAPAPRSRPGWPANFTAQRSAA